MSTIAQPRPRRSAGGAHLRGGARLRGLVRGREADPRWVRPALLTILAAAATLCLWHLTRNGYSNTYYAAAARAGSESWKAWFFGAIDPGSFITVDKPPLSLWAMGLSARVLGFGSFSILLPQALATIGAVGLLFATVRRQFGPSAGLVAAGALAVTPVTIALARVNNPDAILILLLVASAWALQRALESGRTKHLAWCGAFVGLAFMTKMLQGWMVVPALALVYAVAGPPRLGTRIRQLGIAGAVMVAVSAAWPVAVTLWPGSKPYIGGSTDGSIWNLIFGYNGFGRLTGGSGGGQGASFGGQSGIFRMLNEQVGGQVAWLLPFAAVALVAGLWLTRRAPRTDRRRAGLLLFGVWAIVHVVVFSSQKGIFHPYYVGALAPAVAALTGAGVAMLGARARDSWGAVLALAAGIGWTAVLAVALLGRTASYAPALRVVIPVAAVLAIAGLAARRAGVRRLAAGTLAAAAIALFAGPAAYSLATVGHALNGNNVTAGPTTSGGMGFGMGGGMGGVGGLPSSATGTRSSTAARPGAGGARMGGTASTALIRYLEAHQGSAKFLVAAQGSQSSAPIIIASGKAVVTIGGFNGGDPAPTVAQLAAMAKSGQVRYFLVGSQGGGGMNRGGSGVRTWITTHATKVSGVSTGGSGTLYRYTG
jgi:4-amino-4-deoxy-L-arabinose transferase-like glycosyltransferase